MSEHPQFSSSFDIEGSARTRPDSLPVIRTSPEHITALTTHLRTVFRKRPPFSLEGLREGQPFHHLLHWKVSSGAKEPVLTVLSPVEIGGSQVEQFQVTTKVSTPNSALLNALGLTTEPDAYTLFEYLPDVGLGQFRPIIVHWQYLRITE